jgi:hypothetical protein
MSYPFGQPNAHEVQRAHEVAESERFDEDPVDFYNELLGIHGVEATGRIWALACKIYDRNHGVKDS